METVNKMVQLSLDDVMYLLHFVPGLADVDSTRMLKIYATVAKAGGVEPELQAGEVVMPPKPMNPYPGYGQAAQKWEWLKSLTHYAIEGKCAVLMIKKASAYNLKVEAIKIIRQATGLGLKEAKDLVESGDDFKIPTSCLGTFSVWLETTDTSNIKKMFDFFDIQQLG